MPFGLRKSVLCGALALQKQLGDLAKVLEFEVCLPGVLAWCALQLAMWRILSRVQLGFPC